MSAAYDTLSDDELLSKLDNHPKSLDSTGATMLDGMMKQRSGRWPKALSQRQREWAIRMLNQLDHRAGKDDDDE